MKGKLSTGWPSGRRMANHDQARGVTLIEGLVSLAIFLVIFLLTFYALDRTVRLSQFARERETAASALARQFETLSGLDTRTIYPMYGPGGSIGPEFEVEGLSPCPGETKCGHITFFVDETDTSEEARALGLPMDLDGDGEASTYDVSDSYMILPIKITVCWQNPEGNQKIEGICILSRLKGLP
jgi:hypothetical protein